MSTLTASPELDLIKTEIVLADGRTVGSTLAADPWIEHDLLAPVFERDAAGLPRFTLVYAELPRGHAKSSYAGSIALAETYLHDSTDVVIAGRPRPSRDRARARRGFPPAQRRVAQGVQAQGRRVPPPRPRLSMAHRPARRQTSGRAPWRNRSLKLSEGLGLERWAEDWRLRVGTLGASEAHDFGVFSVPLHVG